MIRFLVNLFLLLILLILLLFFYILKYMLWLHMDHIPPFLFLLELVRYYFLLLLPFHFLEIFLQEDLKLYFDYFLHYLHQTLPLLHFQIFLLLQALDEFLPLFLLFFLCSLFPFFLINKFFLM